VHEPGCLWRLGPEHRERLGAALALDPFPRPRCSPDEELDFIGRVRAHRLYAVQVLDDFARRFL
jgi:hypothetical protein